MTDNEIIEYISIKPKIKLWLGDIYCHTDLTWKKTLSKQNFTYF